MQVVQDTVVLALLVAVGAKERKYEFKTRETLKAGSSLHHGATSTLLMLKVVLILLVQSYFAALY